MGPDNFLVVRHSDVETIAAGGSFTPDPKQDVLRAGSTGLVLGHRSRAWFVAIGHGVEPFDEPRGLTARGLPLLQYRLFPRGASGVAANALTVNVNIAPSELAQREFGATVSDVITHQHPPVGLQLELTETALIEDPSLPATLRHFKNNLGVRAALQNFGTGYSSLASLTRFQIDELKIDRSLIRTLTDSHGAPGRSHCPSGPPSPAFDSSRSVRE